MLRGKVEVAKEHGTIMKTGEEGMTQGSDMERGKKRGGSASIENVVLRGTREGTCKKAEGRDKLHKARGEGQGARGNIKEEGESDKETRANVRMQDAGGEREGKRKVIEHGKRKKVIGKKVLRGKGKEHGLYVKRQHAKVMRARCTKQHCTRGTKHSK
jgi:hypothetical protein